MDKYQRKLNKERKNLLIRYGFDPSKLTKEQISIMFVIEDAPEDYHMDGEIDAITAEKLWIQKLMKHGFGRNDYKRIKRMIIMG